MTLRALRTVLQAAWRRPRGVEMLAVGGAVVGLAAASMSRDRPLPVNAEVLLSLALVLLCQHLLQGVVRQNHPHLARLMPQQRGALLAGVRLLILACLLGVVTLWALLVPDERPVMLFLAPIVLWIGSCLAMARPWSALILPVLVIGGLLLGRGLGMSKTESLWVGIAMGVTLVLLVLPQLLRKGDASHVAQWHRQRNTEAVFAVSLEGGKLGALQGQGWLARLMVWWLWPTRRLLNAATAAVQGPDDALRRAQWVVNPSVSVAQQIWMLLSVALPVGAAGVLPMVWRGPGPAWNAALGQGMIVGLAMWFFVLTVGASITEHWSTRGEQALLRLLPGMPQGHALRQGWARVLRRHTLVGWAVHAALALAAAVAWQPAAWPHALAAVLLLAPAAWLLPLRRWQHEGAPRSSWMNWASAWALLSGLVAASPLAGGPALWPLTLLVWAGAAVLTWRWTRPPHATPWPTGHAGALDD